MHVYRFRSSNLLSHKGLLYDEWYFASKDELNDPIDMQSRFEFEAVENSWRHLLYKVLNDQDHANKAAFYFTSLGPLSYESLINDFDKHRSRLIQFIFRDSSVSLYDIDMLRESLSNLLEMLTLYAPGSGYSVSFSRICTDMLMWSHYAASHKGFCIIYRPIDGRLSQCPDRVKRSIKVSDGHSSAVETAFELKDVNYSDELRTLSAYTLLPQAFSNYKFETESERLEYHENTRQQLLTKNECWKYEQECRLMLPQSRRYISGESDYTSLQRLFHYDFDQVVGVIFGARMTARDIESVREIINHKLCNKYRSNEKASQKRYLFSFLYQQAEICSSSRAIKLRDLDLNFMGRTLLPGSELYARELDRWKKSEGTVMENGQFSHDPIPE